MKRCKECLHWKPPDEFHRHESTADRLRSICKACLAERQERYRLERMAAHLAYQREYTKRPDVKERRNDYERLRRFRKRVARKDGSC